MRLTVALAALLLLLCTPLYSTALAEEPDELFQKGVDSFGKGRYEKAIGFFTGVLESNPGDYEALILRGMARYHNGDYKGSIDDLARATQFETPYRARGMYYLGLAYSNRNNKEKAEKVFLKLFSEYPDSPESGKLGYAHPEINAEEMVEPSAFTLLFSQEFNFDSNADKDATGGSDYNLFSFAYGKYKTPFRPFNLKSYCFWNNYFKDDELDISGIAAGPELDLDLSHADSLKVGFCLSKIWLGGTEYSTKTQYTCTWKRKWGDGWYSDLRLRAGQKSYDDEESENLDGDQTRARTRIWVYPDGYAHIDRIRFTGEYTIETADEDYLDWSGASVGMEVRWKLRNDVKITTGASCENRLYEEVHPDFGVKRDEFRVEGLLELAIDLSEALSIYGKVEQTFSESNIGFFEYNRTLIGIGITVFY